MSTITIEAEPEATSGLRLQGALQLQVSGRSWKLATQPPWHCTLIPQARHLLAIPADASGGLRGGDRFCLDLQLDQAAALVWQAPSASLLYPSSAGTDATAPGILTTRIRVAAGCSLVYLARPIIPCSGAAIEQRTEIELEVGASLYYQELWTSGRLAAAERFQFRFIDAEFKLSVAGRPLYHEAWQIGNEPGFPRGPAGLADLNTWGMAVGIGEVGLAMLERETSLLQAQGLDCVQGALAEAAVLSRFGSGQGADRLFARVLPVII